MKTICVNDELYDLLTRAASRAGKTDVPVFLETVAEVVHERDVVKKEERRLNEVKILQRLDEIPPRRTLCDWFVTAMSALLKLSADRFSELEGLTKEGGQVVFVSSNRRIIENTAGIANPVKLSSGDWYVNASGGVRDFEIILDLAARRLGTTVGFVEQLKQRTNLRPEIDFE